MADWSGFKCDDCGRYTANCTCGLEDFGVEEYEEDIA